METKAFADTHPVLSEKIKSLEGLFNKWDELTNFLREYRSNGNLSLDSASSKTFSDYYIELNKIVQQCLRECEELILK